MKEDYLWDKSGEVDPEVEELENLLGRLRYQRPAQPLPLPVVSRPWLRFNSRALAVAAAVVILLLAGALLLKLRHTSTGVNEISAGPTPTPGPVNSIGNTLAGGNKPPAEPENPPAPRNIVTPRAPLERSQLVKANYRAAKSPRELQLEERYRRRGELAKEQLIKALQITSEKLNVVQKKIQGTRESGPIS